MPPRERQRLRQYRATEIADRAHRFSDSRQGAPVLAWTIAAGRAPLAGPYERKEERRDVPVAAAHDITAGLVLHVVRVNALARGAIWSFSVLDDGPAA